jgi:DNA-binding Xre family transcriptional regulator
MRTTTRMSSRAARRARCHKPKDEPKMLALVPMPTLPDIYAFGEEAQAPELIQALDARRLPSTELESILLPESADRPRAAFGKTTWERLHTGGQWSFRLGLRWEFPGLIPGLPWIPQITRREVRYEPMPERPELPVLSAPINPEQIRERVRVGLAHAIREVRDERYLDAGQLAEEAGVPRWQLTAIEEARLDPIPFAAFSALASALDMKMSELLRRVEESSSEVQL